MKQARFGINWQRRRTAVRRAPGRRREAEGERERVCLGEGTQKRRYGGRSPEGCYGARLETPALARVGLRGGTTRGKPGVLPNRGAERR